MRCKKCKNEASEGRPLLFSPIIRITRSKAVRRPALNDRNGARGVIRPFDCFFKETSVLGMENEVLMKIRTLLVHKDLVKYSKMKQNIPCHRNSTSYSKQVHKDENGYSILSILGLRPNPQILEIRGKNECCSSKMFNI